MISRELRPVEVQAKESLFAGDGEVQALLDRVDWAATPLGGVSTWSPALRTMVGMSLRNHFPLILWWGRDLIQVYNDAFSPILAGKHPRSLAQPAAECWAEIWSIVGPMIETPFEGGRATWSDDLLLLINRKGFVEETHFKFAYSPVPDQSVAGTGIGGVLGTVAEITEEVFAARQLATLRDLSRHAGDAATSAMACELSARTLAGNDRDIPCSLFYLIDPAGRSAQLAGSSGFGAPFAKDALSQTILFEESAAAVWPISSMIRDGIARSMRERRATIVSQVAFMDLPRGAWKEPPNQVLILPLFSPEQADVYGVLLIGVSPRG